jgi:GAF domain-containing protein
MIAEASDVHASETVTEGQPLSISGLANLFANIQRRFAPSKGLDDALVAVTDAAVRIVPGAEHAGITRGRDGKFVTVAATSDIATRTDEIQYSLRSGPCVDAVLKDRTFRAADLRTDPRWPRFGRLAAEQTGVLSMLSFRLFIEDDNSVTGLNLYACTPEAFDENSEMLATLLATHGALAIQAAAALERVEHLQTALDSSRDIGVAMGILMYAHKLSRAQAFDLLRIASQHTHRKLRDVAHDVADTGTLDLPPIHTAKN